MKKTLLTIGIIVIILGAFQNLIANAAPITPVSGGGTQTSTAQNGYLLIGNASGTYSKIASSSLAGAGLSSSTIQALFSATAPIVYNSSTGAFSWINSNNYIATSTGLTTANFASTNISQWTNNSGYITTSTNNFGGLTNGSITATSPITWSGGNVIACPTCYLTSNPSGYIATSTGLTTANFSSGNISQWTNNSGYLTSLTGALLAANNLSDLTNTSTARTNLGLGSIATHPTTDYLASSTPYVSTVNGGSGAITISSSSLGVVYNPLWITTSTYNGNFGTAASHPATDFLASSTNLAPSSTIYGASYGLGTSGSNLVVSSTFASSSVSFGFPNATTTAPYSLQKLYTNGAKNIASVSCDEYASATSTMELYYNLTNASSGIQQVVLSSIACGVNGTSTATFTTSTIPAGAYLFALVTGVSGTPTQTTISLSATKK
jgi:hypothetical protein